MNTLRHDELRLEWTELNVNDILRETLSQLNGTIGASVLMRDHPVPSILGDRHQLISALTNLILNASDALGENGRIIIETVCQNDSVSISVSDNGCGMTEEFMRDSLFRPFRTTKKKGIGIGMFQAKMIIEAHNGTIHATSSPGQGTTFRLLLPIKA
jgi:signal transduction histidine kinase